MQIKLLQLNLYAATYWENLKQFLLQNDFDILQFQEVVGEDTRIGNIDAKENTYKKVSELLEDNFTGRLFKTETFTSSPTSFDGVATFVKTDIKILEENDIIQKEATFPFDSKRTDYENVGRGTLAIKVKKDTKTFWLLNTHFAWSPTPEDSEEKINQARILADFLKTLREPFILSGDFNATPHTKTISFFNQRTQNLISLNDITNTLNPRLHKANHLFPPGIAVDYIFVSPDIKVQNFHVADAPISDHFGLQAVLEV